jgi:hypothetical protein
MPLALHSARNRSALRRPHGALATTLGPRLPPPAKGAGHGQSPSPEGA